MVDLQPVERPVGDRGIDRIRPGGMGEVAHTAKQAAGEKDVMVWGGADTINQYLAAGLLDELELHVVPRLLGGGSRLFEGVGGVGVGLEQVRVVEAPGVTHLKYRPVAT